MATVWRGGTHMQDALIGTWKLNPDKSEFDPNHRPLAGTMVLEMTPEGHYALTAEGVTEKRREMQAETHKAHPRWQGASSSRVSRPDQCSHSSGPEHARCGGAQRRRLGGGWRYICRIARRKLTNCNQFRIRHTAQGVQTEDSVGSA